MMSSLKLFYAEPSEIEIAKLCRREAKRRGEQLSNKTIMIRTKRRLADFDRLDVTPKSSHITVEIEKRLWLSCISRSKIEEMRTDISIASVAIAELKTSTSRGLCVSHNYDLFHIECAASKDLEVWSALERKKTSPSCDDVTESMIQNSVTLDALI